MPPAPPMFSTTTDWPRISANRAATRRPPTSIELPGANEITMVRGRVGHSCARAGTHSAPTNAAAITTVRIRISAWLPLHAGASAAVGHVSLRSQPRRLDRNGPFLDFTPDERLQIFGRA